MGDIVEFGATASGGKLESPKEDTECCSNRQHEDDSESFCESPNSGIRSDCSIDS